MKDNKNIDTLANTNEDKKKKKTKIDFAAIKEAEKKEMDERIERTILSDSTPFIVSEAYKTARTNIMFAMKEKNSKAIIITSANPGEGKSTNCLNVAISFAQTGSKVVIIDADMRKPRIHKYLKMKNGQGTSNILGGFAKLEDCICHSEERNLDVITAGHIPPNPAELLASAEMDEMLKKLNEVYDYIFIDTPPLNVVTDAAVVGKKVAGVILIARHNTTGKDMLEKSINSLKFAEIKILGFILAAVERGQYAKGHYYSSRRKYGYKRRYGYGKYGYGKYGYGKYGYGKYGYGKYGYGKYGYGNGYGYGYGYGYDEAPETDEVSEENNN